MACYLSILSIVNKEALTHWDTPNESISFLVGIGEKLPSFMLRFSPAFGSLARVELSAEVRANISFL